MSKKKLETNAIDMAQVSMDKVEAGPLPDDRAATRFRQIAELEKSLAKIRRKIADKKTELQTLKDQETADLEQILEAARDEGDLPLPLGE